MSEAEETSAYEALRRSYEEAIRQRRNARLTSIIRDYIDNDELEDGIERSSN